MWDGTWFGEWDGIWFGTTEFPPGPPSGGSTTYAIPSGLSMNQKKGLAALLACKPCCDGGSGSGSGSGSSSATIEYTDCRCAYPYTFSLEDPQPPPQPAGGYFPTILYYLADLDGGSCDCFTTPPWTDVTDCESIIGFGLSANTSVSYCSRSLNIPLKLCSSYVYESDEIPLCDTTYTVTQTPSGGTSYTFTIRRFMKVVVTLECSSCLIIDDDFLINNLFADSGLDPETIYELYGDWIGLEYCYPATATINRTAFYRVLSQDPSMPNTLYTSFGSLTDRFGTYNPEACELWGTFAPATGGRIKFGVDGAFGFCTDIVLSQLADSFSQDIYCCTSNNFTTPAVSDCCKPTIEKLYIPGACE